MRRRGFIAGLGSVAAMPLAAPAQERVKRLRIGFLIHLAADDPEAMARTAGFCKVCRKLAGQRIAIFKLIIDRSLN